MTDLNEDVLLAVTKFGLNVNKLFERQQDIIERIQAIEKLYNKNHDSCPYGPIALNGCNVIKHASEEQDTSKIQTNNTGSPKLSDDIVKKFSVFCNKEIAPSTDVQQANTVICAHHIVAADCVWHHRTFACGNVPCKLTPRKQQ